ncbi:hypothetical protein V3C99_004604, partial [Haemonchus contortus]
CTPHHAVPFETYGQIIPSVVIQRMAKWKVSIGEPCTLEEDLHSEFRMDFKFSCSEASCDDVLMHSSEVSIKPASKTISAFLNTKGGNIYIGIDVDGIIRGVRLTASMKEHLLLALSVCISQFKPPVPPDLVKVHIIELENPTVIQREANRAEELAKEFAQDYDRPIKFRTKERPAHHAIGNVKCPCEHSEDIMESKLYLVVIEVRKSPDGTIYQNEEGCAYRRRYGSNKMIVLNDIVALMSKSPVPQYLEHMIC